MKYVEIPIYPLGKTFLLTTLTKERSHVAPCARESSNGYGNRLEGSIVDLHVSGRSFGKWQYILVGSK